MPERTASPPGTIRLTDQAVAIQQRIDAAALRRLNAANDWIDDGIVARDLCGGAFGPSAFQSGIPWVGGGTNSALPPSPRPLNVVKKNKPKADFEADLRQIRINDRISRALLVRAEVTEERLNNLTGGNLASGAALIQLVAQGVQDSRPLYPGLAIGGPLPPSTSSQATPLRIGSLPPAGNLVVSVAQLRKTQQRSQEAIEIANRANDRINAGLTEEQFRAGSIGASALTPSAPPAQGGSPPPQGAPVPGDIYNCSDFPLPDGTTAQQYLERFPSDPSRLDGDSDGLACQG